MNIAMLLLMFIANICGCKSATSLAPTTIQKQTATYPPRPTTPPPSFKLFHQTTNTLTLTVPETATDTDIAALLYQLHDAAQSHSFDTLHLPQKLIDARDPIVWFHIYRGAKCASEKYTSGTLPCGGSYHAAGDYTLGDFTHPNRDDALLLHHDPESETQLWNPDTPPLTTKN
jgi:hypothetical protein